MASPGSQSAGRNPNTNPGSNRNAGKGSAGGSSGLPGTKKPGVDYGALSNVTGGQPLGASAATISGPTTSYGAPTHPGGRLDPEGRYALTPDRWNSLTDQVSKYNEAARQWNAGTGRSFANFVNRAQPFGFTMEAPELSKPKTYVDGDYHLGVNPLGLAGSVGGAIAGIPGVGTVAGGLYDAFGGPHVMLGGGDVPSGWKSGLGTGSEAPDFSGNGATGPQSPGRGDAGGTHLLPAIAGNPAAQQATAAPSPTGGSLLPPITAPTGGTYPGAYMPVAGPTPYGWQKPAWAYR